MTPKTFLAGSLVIAGTLLLALEVTGKGVPATPVAAASTIAIVEVHPFRLDDPAVHWYRAEQPAYDRGWVLVLEAEPALLALRQTQNPVLYVGDETAERVNIGDVSGRAVVIVPDADGTLDLANAPVFFGAAELPERITREIARDELADAISRGFTAEAALADRTREELALPDAYELHYFASTLVEEHSPMEADLIAGLRAPRLER